MGKEMEIAKTYVDISTKGLVAVEEVLESLAKMIASLEENFLLRKMRSCIEKEGAANYKVVDERIVDDLQKELEKRSIPCVITDGIDPLTGEKAKVMIYPPSFEEEIKKIELQVMISKGLTSEISKNQYTETFKDEEFNILKNIDKTVAQQMKKYSDEVGLSISIDDNKDGSCNIYSLKSQTDKLATAYILASYEVNSPFGSEIYNRNAYREKLENTIEDYINKNKEFYLVSRDGNSILHVDDEKCDYSYRDEDGVFRTQTERKGADLSQFISIVATKQLEIGDDCVFMTQKEYFENNKTNNKILNEKLKDVPIKTEEEKKMEKNVREIKEKYEIINADREKQFDLKEALENFYAYARTELRSNDEYVKDNEEILDSIKTDISKVNIDVKKGSEINELRRIEEKHERKIDIVKDKEEQKKDEREEKENNSR